MALTSHSCPVYHIQENLIKSIMKKFIFFTFLIQISCSSDYSLPLNLNSDYWDGEKLVIIAEFNVNEMAELTIQKTFSPVQKQLPEPQFVKDKDVFIIQNSLIFEKMYFDPIDEKYKSTKPIKVGFDYKIVIPQLVDTIMSKSIFIPDEKIFVNDFKSSVIDSVIIGEARLSFQNFEKGSAAVRINFVGPKLIMNFKNKSSKSKYEPDCYIGSLLNIACIKDSTFYMQNSVEYFNKRYTIAKEDSLKLSIQYISPELENLNNSNAYNGSEFGVNNAFVSSFTNAYGIFGYKHTLSIKIPIKQ